jgi:galactokinase
VPAELGHRFARVYGRPPQGVWAAPGRVNLIGEHVDYNDGLVLPFALEQRTFAAAAARDDGLLRVRSTQREGVLERAVRDLSPDGGEQWWSYPAGVVWAMREAGHPVAGMDVLLDGQVPSGAGLSSSASVECAVAVAADDLSGLRLPVATLARLAQQAENDFVGVPCGLMDQMASMACTAGHALLFDVRSEQVEQVPFAPEADDLRLVVVDTGVKHALGDGAYADRRAACERAAALLGVAALRDVTPPGLDDALARLPAELVSRVRHVVTEVARVERAVAALRSADWSGLGAEMTGSHRSLRDDYEVSSPELDAAVDASLRAGALGARMTGGGFGGSAIALVEQDRVGTLADCVRAAFAERGFAPPGFVAAAPRAGAGRVG